MAKIFRTEELSVNGDEIRISAPLNTNNLVFEKTNDQGVQEEITSLSSLMLKDTGLDSDISSLAELNSAGSDDLSSDISSLQAQSVVDVSNLDEDVSSLQAQRDADEEVTDSDVSSLQAQSVVNINNLDEDVSSLQAQRNADEAITDSDISSLSVKVVDNDVVAVSATIDTSMGDHSYDVDEARVTIAFGREFSTTPNVVGIMQSAAGSAIIGVQLIEVTTTGATFQLSDDVPTDGTYSIEALASV